MQNTDATARGDERSLGPPGAYVRFVVLSGARTGSTMLAHALNSHPQAMCFGELFNYTVKGAIDYIVDGYDKTDAEGLALRERDPVAFLRQRIFCHHPEQVRAVGLKYHYLHYHGFPGALDALIEAEDVRVLHLKRRNLLRMFLSLQMAYQTGVWKRDKPGRWLTSRNAGWALRHPLSAAGRLRARLGPDQPSAAPSPSVTISEQELRTFMHETELSIGHYDKLFAAHPRRDIFFEEIEADPQRAFDEALAFLDLPPRRLQIALERQHPEPLRKLIENYDELSHRFRDSSHAWMFEEQLAG